MVPGVALVVVQQCEVTDAEYEGLLQFVEENLPKVKRMLVYTETAGPTTSQRARSNELFARIGAPQGAVMTGSRLVLGIVTAFSWVIGSSKIRAFPLTNFEGATDSLNMSAQEKAKLYEMLKTLAPRVGVKLAFNFP